MNKYRVIEVKDHLGFKWYVPQRFAVDVWEDISCGWGNLKAAIERIRRDITQKVVWECTEEEMLKQLEEKQEIYNPDNN